MCDAFPGTESEIGGWVAVKQFQGLGIDIIVCASLMIIFDKQGTKHCCKALLTTLHCHLPSNIHFIKAIVGEFEQNLWIWAQHIECISFQLEKKKNSSTLQNPAYKSDYHEPFLQFSC